MWINFAKAKIFWFLKGDTNVFKYLLREESSTAIQFASAVKNNFYINKV